MARFSVRFPIWNMVFSIFATGRQHPKGNLLTSSSVNLVGCLYLLGFRSFPDEELHVESPNVSKLTGRTRGVDEYWSMPTSAGSSAGFCGETRGFSAVRCPRRCKQTCAPSSAEYLYVCACVRVPSVDACVRVCVKSQRRPPRDAFSRGVVVVQLLPRVSSAARELELSTSIISAPVGHRPDILRSCSQILRAISACFRRWWSDYVGAAIAVVEITAPDNCCSLSRAFVRFQNFSAPTSPVRRFCTAAILFETTPSIVQNNESCSDPAAPSSSSLTCAISPRCTENFILVESRFCRGTACAAKTGITTRHFKRKRVIWKFPWKDRSISARTCYRW